MLQNLEGTISERTKELYAKSWRRFALFCEEKGLSTLAAASFLAWRKELVAQNLGPNTINGHLSAVRSILRSAVSNEEVSLETYAQIKSVSSVSKLALRNRLKPEKELLTENKIEEIIDAIDTSTLIGLRDRAVIVVLATTGVRIEELTKLALDDWKVDENIVYVQGKTDVRPRAVPVSAYAAACMSAWLYARNNQSRWIFTSFTGRSMQVQDKPMTTQAAHNVVTTRASAVGILISAHDFRRFVATTLASRNIVAAQAVLGHKSIGTTQIYVKRAPLPAIDWLDRR